MLVAGFTATAQGVVPAATVAMTVLFAPLITVTSLLPLFATYIVLVIGFTATPSGAVPAEIVAVVFVAPSITVTLLPTKFVT